VLVGGLASAATTGALIAIGHRAGSIDLPFAAIGALLVHRVTANGTMTLVLAGLVLHVVALFVWSVVYVGLVDYQRWRLLPAALVVATAHFVLSGIVAWSTGHGLASALALGDRLVFAVILALALAVGMRFAFFTREMHDTASSRRAPPL
jgi:hypothetical protein